MVDQKIKKAHGIENFFIATFTIGSIFLSYLLVKKYLEHARILEISGIFIWIIACIVQIYLQSNKLLNSKSENTFNDQDKYQVSPTVQRLIGVIAAFILGILVLLGGDVNIFKTQPLVQPEFELFNDYSYIATGILFIIGALRDLFDLKKSLLRSILFLFEFMLIVSAVIAMFIYTAHMTEVS
jgi:hypothetical protein